MKPIPWRSALLVVCCLGVSLLENRVLHAQNVIDWGSNLGGPSKVPLAATNVFAVAAGWSNSLALRADGAVLAWGSGPATNLPPHLTNAVAIASGANHALALLLDRSVVAWGDATYGQTNIPSGATNLIAVEAGYFHSLALRADGSVLAWGKNAYGQCDVPTSLSNAVAITAGAEHSMAICADGTVFTWGGVANSSNPLSYARIPIVKAAKSTTSIAAGAYQNLALSGSGQIVAWGYNHKKPRVPAAATNCVLMVAATNYNLALKANGQVIAWGTGLMTNIPANVTNIMDLAAGPSHWLAVRADGAKPRILGSLGYEGQAYAGSFLPLGIRAVGSAPLYYQWLTNGVTITNTSTPFPQLIATLGSDDLNYQVIVSNSFGTATSSIARVMVGPINCWGDDLGGKLRPPRLEMAPLKLAAGETHCVALGVDGTVAAWGQNSDGRTNVPPTATNVVAVAAGKAHSLALRSDGSVIGWGRNWDGQTDIPTAATNVVEIAAGWGHSLALRGDGTVVAWGNNDYGQTDFPFLGLDVVSISAGFYHNMALRADGTVVTWAFDYPTPPSVTNVVAVAAGWEHCLALRSDGKVIAWGDNTYGQSNVPASATNIVAISAGYFDNLALKSDGTVIAWGKSWLGVTVVPPGLRNVAAIAAGVGYNLALVRNTQPEFGIQLHTILAYFNSLIVIKPNITGGLPITYQWFHDGVPLYGATNIDLTIRTALPSDAGLYVLVASNSYGETASSPFEVRVNQGPSSSSIGAWGGNSVGQCDVPRTVVSPVAVAAGMFHALALNSDGSVVAWGKNTDGQAKVPESLTNVVAIAAGGTHSMALRDDGTVFAWGRNWDGQTNVPPAATNVVAISAGWAHSVALRGDGVAVVWGNDDYGQGKTSFLAIDAIAVSAGYYHNMALRSDGAVVAWGLDYETPPSATNVVAISAGWEHCLALKQDGSVLAWGNNVYGQSTVPTSATNVIAISAGYYHNMALKADGTVLVWGKPFLGVTNIPGGLHNVTRISAGEDYNLVMVASGPPQFGHQLSSISGHAGGSVFVTATVQGIAPTRMQWYRDGEAVVGATNQSLLIPALRLVDSGKYTLVATNNAGATQSGPIALSVQADATTISSVGAWGADNSGQCSVSRSVDNPRKIAAGAFHALALNGNGTVVAWGKNRDGQTSVPPSTTNVVGVAAGGDHSLALKDDGSVIGWGRNWDRQVDIPTDLSNVVAISAGFAHSLALRSDKTLVAWGNNECLQTNIPAISREVTAIAAGYYHNLALLSDRSVVAWGLDNIVPEDATNVVGIAAGWWHSLALRADGSVVAWGDNSYGQCDVPASATNVVEVSAGYYHSLARLANGKTVVWGKAINGVLNTPTTLRNVSSVAAGQDYCLVMVETGPPRFASDPVPGEAHVGGCSILDSAVEGTQPMSIQWLRDGDAIIGATSRFLQLNQLRSSDSATYSIVATNSSGQWAERFTTLQVSPHPAVEGSPRFQNVLLGKPVSIEARCTGQEPLTFQWRLNGRNLTDGGRITGSNSRVLSFTDAKGEDDGIYSIVVSNVVGVTTGIVATVSASSILAWGNNSSGQLSIPLGTGEVVGIAAGDDHNLALRADGSIVAWGDNSTGQNNLPPSTRNVVAIAEGSYHSLALRADGTVVAWGDNSFGQATIPASATNVVAIAAGDVHSVALSSNGKVTMWGTYFGGQGPTILPDSNIVAVAAGGRTTLMLQSENWIDQDLELCATASGHRNYSWGGKSKIRTSYLWPYPKPDLSNIVALAASPVHYFALLADGSIVSVGSWYYSSYQIIDDTHYSQSIIGLSAGAEHSVFLHADGTVTTTGNNYFRQSTVPPLAKNASDISAGASHTLALIANGPPKIPCRPMTCQVTSGRAAMLTAQATGSAPLAWQWFHNGIPIPGATKPFLYLPTVSSTDSGSYKAVVSNSLGQTESADSILQVLDKPFFPDPLQLVTTTLGMTTTSSPTCYSDSPTSFQWYFNGISLPESGRFTGSTTSNLMIMRSTLADSGAYSVVASNAFGMTTNHAMQLAVTPVFCWGNNTPSLTNVPRSATNVMAISAGATHCLALKQDGTLAAWGSTAYGLTNPPAMATNVVQVSAGSVQSLVLRADGTVVSWGSTSYGLTNVPPSATNVVAIATGSTHSLALKAEGTVVAWGDNLYGQTNVPILVTNVIAISAGTYHSLALREDGTVVSWGRNTSGETNVPANATQVLAIAAGNGYSLALRSNGSVIAWGAPTYGVTNVPSRATNVVSIAAGYTHAVALQREGTIVSWGTGGAPLTNPPSWLTNVVAISAGSGYSAALLSEDGVAPDPLPLPRSSVIGSEVFLLSGITSLPSTRFQWQLNGLDIPDATNAWLKLTTTTWKDVGTYRVVANPPFGPAQAREIILTLTPDSLRFLEPPNGVLFGNGVARLSLSGASGIGPVVLLASSDMASWVPVLTNPPTIGSVVFYHNGAAAGNGLYYRAFEGAISDKPHIGYARPFPQAGQNGKPLELTGLSASGPVIIYASSNSLDWEAIFTNPPTLGPLRYLEKVNPALSPRYYKASEAR